MQIDGIKLSEGSEIDNLTVAKGTAFPSLPDQGELFYRTDGANVGLYVYDGATWGPVGAGSGTVTSVTATAPLISSGGDTPAISIQQATGAVPGYLSAADWNTFSGKQAALGFTPVNKAGDTMTGSLTATGFTGSLTGTASLATSLVGSQWGIPYQSAPNTTSMVVAGIAGQVLTSNGNAAPTWQSVAASAAAAGTLTGTTLASNVVSSSLTSVGTLTSLGVTGTVAAGAFSGPLTGNVTGNVSGTAATITGVYSGAITSEQVTTGLGFTPYNATNPAGYISGINSVNVTTALGYTPVNTAGDTMTGALLLNAAPSAPLGAATKQYVDSAIAGLTWKAPVQAATTVDITLSGTQTIDGVALVVGNRVLVKNQTATATNGVYVVASGAWTRATDFDEVSPIDEVNSAAIFVIGGTTQADTGWTQTSLVVTVGTDPITFVQFSSVNMVAATALVNGYMTSTYAAKLDGIQAGATVGATGSSGNAVFYENDQNITASYTLTAGKNAGSFGPININAGVTVTVPAGATWSIV